MSRTFLILPGLALMLGGGSPAWGQGVTSRVGDVTRLQGQGVNKFMGIGLVTGLNGTGDGDGYYEAMRSLAASLTRQGHPLNAIDLKGSKNVAIVNVYLVVPEHGAREGDRLDVKVASFGAAKSLAGGHLQPTPLVYEDPNVADLFAYASGLIVVDEDTPTSGRVPNGATMQRDIPMNVVATGGAVMRSGFDNPWIKANEEYITLVLDETVAGWPMAAAIAQAVDKELALSADVERVALAMDAKNVVVLVPAHQRGDVASWIRDVQRTPLFMEANEARVVINRTTGTVVVTGDTRISPVIVSQLGLTVTVFNPGPGGAPLQPAIEQRDFVALDAEQSREPNVRDLLEALNRLKVPFKDRVAILEEIHRAGKLHAALLYED
jgi:flagellar P-ring protein precursor FlgI